jgi:hypothetical protein
MRFPRPHRHLSPSKIDWTRRKTPAAPRLLALVEQSDPRCVRRLRVTLLTTVGVGGCLAAVQPPTASSTSAPAVASHYSPSLLQSTEPDHFLGGGSEKISMRTVVQIVVAVLFLLLALMFQVIAFITEH